MYIFLCMQLKSILNTILKLNYILQEFVITMIVLCFAGDILGQMRVLIQTGSQVVLSEIGNGAIIPEEAIHLIFGGALVEVISLASYF